ncbi:leader peptidase (prepilin peptidase)/N-methyltransferase [Microterricola gilva]|uniref:Prepilin leader peptidase/N-methyltransferase n=1 Tax=Microterricola gilva TaxID=393267 RepID=A0A4Q8AIB1_9MICO|nr:A24 family peptidase [Microterricola gilva]RZU64114.1 leader peptidase (prepilin peptidase)/N-methyltransferase [Microterricola gilva]
MTPLAAPQLLTALTLAVGLFGLLIGSFLNVVVYRVPAGLSIVSPPSACPGCGAQIRPGDNVPVLSWLLLRGKCRACREPISARYPLVELGTGLAFAIVTVWLVVLVSTGGVSTSSASGDGSTSAVVANVLMLLAYLYLAAISIALALIDIDTHRLPNAIVLPSYVVAAVLLAASGLMAQDFDALLWTAIGGIAMWMAYFVMAFIYPAGMGFGDVKLAGVLGLYLGFLGLGPLLVGAFAAFVLGGIFAVVLLITKRAGRKSGIPFGPWMLLGAWLGIFWGDAIWQGYLGLIGL